MDKSDNAYKTIGEVAKILNLKTNKNEFFFDYLKKILKKKEKWVI